MSNKRIVYKEIVLQDKAFYMVMNGVILLLIILTLIFATAKIWAGVISTGLATISMIFIKEAMKKAELTVTDQDFIMKFWFFTFRTKLSDIDTVEIKDVSLLPRPYRGHVKFWARGIKFFDGLRVFRLRDGDGVHITTKKGKTIIVTSKNNKALLEALEKQE